MFKNSQNPLPKALFTFGIILAFLGVLLTFNFFQKEDESKTTTSTYLIDKLGEVGFLDEELPISFDKTSNLFREWCQIDYQDLSKDPVFSEFQVWLKKFESSYKIHDHSNGKLKQVLLEGEKLAQRRAKVLQKIIRGDPKTALSLATPQNILESLPGAVRKHLEKWESDFVDIQAKHVCFDPKHPGGFINRRATMHDGRNLRAWVYGKRRNLPSIKNLSVWGVSLDGDFAISDVPIMRLENGTEKFLLMGGKKFPYSNLKEFELFNHDVRTAENRAFLNQIPIRYPRTASSSGLTDYYERKYDLITNPSTWEEAKAIAAENNGTLVIINSEEENRFIRNMLDPDQVDYFGFDDEGNQVELAWIGATDSEDENSTIYNLETNTSSVIDLNATEGDWKWVNGDDVSSSYGIEEWVQDELNSSTSPNQDFAAMEFSSLSGNWLDVNATYQLPFVIEYELENEPQRVNVAIDGYRKVLVVPARFEDEGYEGSGSQTQQNSFEPVPQKDLYDAMQMVKDFFLRSSDKTFHLDAVITPTVTIPYPKYYSEEGKGEPNLFDSSGEFLIAKKFEYEDELELAQSARDIAGEMDEAWKWGGAAFNGVLSISIDELNDTKPKKIFSYPPIITFIGGGEDPNNEGLTNQRFEPATGQAVTDATGEIIAIKILSPGAYYYSEPTIQVGSPAVDETDHNYKFNINLGTTCISWVGITTHDHAGAAGVGFVGAAGSYVDTMNTYGLANVITHELGHNFGLLHANKLITKSEKPNSDESEKIDYGNPYSIMGQGSIHMGGDLTVAEKVITKLANNFGLTYSKDISATSYINSDVIGLFSASDVESSTRKETEGSNLADNTFRIYRHDFDAAPLPLRQTNCSVFLPTEVINTLDKNMTYNVIFSGTGEGAEGTLSLLSTNSSDQPNANLEITKTGSGFASEPSAMVLEDEEVILTLDPIWIKDPTGSQWNEDESQYEYSDFSQSTLRDLSSSSRRGLRGLELKATNYSPKGLDYEDLPLNSYWLSYRRSASEYGISVLAGNSGNQENFLLDMTVNTPNDFSDAFLLLGHTFSDYDADVHFTPVSKGGIYPMEYIDVVVNMGSVQDDSAKSPEFSVQVSNPTPSVGEFVNISVDLKEGNTSNYGYSWFVNEIIETSPSFLNKPSILKTFSSSGHYVVRVMVSDLKGGVSSRNVVVMVGDYQKSSFSTLSGTVRANKGLIEGARVAINPAKIIEHTVSITGNKFDHFLPSGRSDPLAFLIDGKKSPQLTFRKGEIHRFYFDSSTEGMPLSFWEHPEYELPRVILNMLATPIISESGEDYSSPPEVLVSDQSSFSNYFSDQMGSKRVGSIDQHQSGFLSDSSLQENLLVTRPFAKSLLIETSVDTVLVRPIAKDIDGNFIQFGGKGQHRDNPPNVFVLRSSFWEDYSDQNATAQAYVDGIGTISPVTSSDIYNSIWETRSASDPIPELVVWGSGGSESRPYDSGESNETNATVSIFVNTEESNVPYRQITISNQGVGFEPNASMAVLQYPLNPFAYWTFDRHESLFEESSDARYQPSPAWNALQKGSSDIFPNDSKLTGYWSFDDKTGSTITAKYGSDIDNLPFVMTDANRSYWGLKGSAIRLDSTDFTNPLEIGSLGEDGSLSMWLKPEGNFIFNIGGSFISYNHVERNCTINGTTSIIRRSNTYDWMHLAVANIKGSNSTFYVDGISSSVSPVFGNLEITSFVGLLDETHIFSTALSEAQIKILGGRSFLDLSGNKVHAAPIGPDFNMSSPDTDPGFDDTDRPGVVNRSPQSKGNTSPPFAKSLGDSYSGESHGFSLVFDDNDSYLDLSPHAFYFALENQGSISFWVKTDGLDENGNQVDQNIFTASCADDNNSFLRIMVRDIGVMQLHAVNDGVEIAKFYTSSRSKVVNSPMSWHHVVLVADGEKSTFWVDGTQAESISYASEGADIDSGDKRTFFSDIQNLNFIGFGSPFFNTENNQTESFRGNLDDLYIYNRALDSEEINYLYNLRMGREQLPRLEAVVDAVGTIELQQNGIGYKETPEISFSYGQDGNETSAFEDNVTNFSDLSTEFQDPTPGQLVYVTSEAKVYSYHHVSSELFDWRYGNNNNGWVEYQLAYAQPILNSDSPNGGIERILWTKDIGELKEVFLPDGRSVRRRFLEYVVDGDGIYPAPSEDFGAPEGLFGYSAPPILKVNSSSGKDASGYALFFADKNHSAEIISSGIGLEQNPFDASGSVRISGKGYRPDQWKSVRQGTFGNEEYELVRTQYSEYWGIDSSNNDALEFDPNIREEQSNNWSALPGHNEPNDSTREEIDRDAIFQDWSHQPGIGEPRNVDMDFNKSLSHITLNHTGVGYSMPVEILLIGGYPDQKTLAQWVADGNATPYDFEPAICRVTSFDENGGINDDIEVVDGGKGYLNAPSVVITGGGGIGATAVAKLADDGSIGEVEVENSGRGYVNKDSYPSATLQQDPLFDPPTERNANLSVRLGGFIGEGGISRCSACASGDHASKNGNKTYHHKEAWIEIWDRNRSERVIDRNGDRALAAAKIRNGKLEKVIVVSSGRGYVDPVAFVRAGPPHLGKYLDHNGISQGFTESNDHKDYPAYKLNNENRSYIGIPHDKVERIWRCVNLREDKVGNFVECGHIFQGQYPPEECPGEIDKNFPIEAENTSQEISNWKTRHTKEGELTYYLNDTESTDNKSHLCSLYDHLFDNSKHRNAQFRSRKCSGKKENFVLINDLYRTPDSSWKAMEAQVTAMVRAGKVSEVNVLETGGMYASSGLAVQGSGTGVDTIPIFDERGENIRIIFDDPSLKNLESDYGISIQNYEDLKNAELNYEVFFPDGAGQGFVERPWSWDWSGDNDPTYGPREKVISRTFKGEEVPESYSEGAINWNYGISPLLVDSLGDRIREIKILDNGVFNSNTSLTGIDIDFNGSINPDIDLDNFPDFIPASATPYSTYKMTKFNLDENASFLHEGMYRSLFVEEPIVNILPHVDNNLNAFESFSSIRLNGDISYDPAADEAYFDIYVDDRMPAKFFYGFESNGSPAMGGEIIVTDGLPVMNWGRNEPMERNMSAYTDQNGYYIIPNLEPGFYNVAVFMEDRKFQDLTFRPDSNLTRVSDIVYIPGFPELLIETDRKGGGRSRLIWSNKSVELSSAVTAQTSYETKILEGIGRGFQTVPELIILPNSNNSNNTLPNIEMKVSEKDGSLTLEIIDDQNTSVYDPDDRFSVIFSSSVQGVDFSEYFQFSEANQSDWGGYLNSQNNGAWLEISPNDANGTGFVEVPISTKQTGITPFNFVARGFEENGSAINTSTVSWGITFKLDPAPVEGNYSSVASIDSITGPSTNLQINSTLRRTGIVGFEILNSGIDYLEGAEITISGGNGSGLIGKAQVDSNGSITGVDINCSGTGYSVGDIVEIDDNNDKNGSNARLSPILGGKLILYANLETADGSLLEASTEVMVSKRNKLSDEEIWLDYYFDSILERNQTWWLEDNDTDNLSNTDEKREGTNPNNPDSDGDGLTDGDELEIWLTDPLQKDTDGDKLNDNVETKTGIFVDINNTGSDPLKFDTDRDGMSDYFESINREKSSNPDLVSNLDPNKASENGKRLSGYIFDLENYDSNSENKLYIGIDLIDPENFDLNTVHRFTDWQEFNSTYPQPYLYENLPPNQTYRISVFLDNFNAGDNNQTYQSGEPYAFWQGVLSTNQLSANLFLKEDPPKIKFDVDGDEEIVLPDPMNDSFNFSITVSAEDLLTPYWDINSTDPKIHIVIDNNLSDYLSIVESKLLGEVNSTIPLGSYQISYQAEDLSKSKSSLLKQRIIIKDEKGPEMILLGENPYPFPYGVEWEDPGYLLTDNRDSSDYFETNKPSIVGVPNTGTIGTYTMTYQAMDSAGNLTTKQRIVEIIDTIAPSFFISENLILISKGKDFTLPFYSATDAVDGDLTSNVTVSGLDTVDIYKVGDYQVFLSVSDTAGNEGQTGFTIRVEPPAYAIIGSAIDGYLVGANVVFDTDGDHKSDLSSYTYTEENGKFSINFSQEEFLKFDLNQDGQLNANEGRIIVSGGVDSSTGDSFSGILLADSNSSVVTPITSIVVELMDLGLEKESAMQLISESFELLQDFDFSAYDPYESAANGDTASSPVLIIGARVATLMKQAEAFVRLLKGASYNSGEVSLALISILATKLKENQNNPSNPLDDGIAEIITSVINDQVDTNLFTLEEVADFAQIVQVSDSLHKTLMNSDKTPAMVASEITKQQLAVKQSVLEELEGIENLQSLASTTSLQTLLDSSETFLSVNLFAPTAEDFTFTLDDISLSSNQELLSLGAVDLDGDEISFSILSGNVDSNGDGIKFLQINSSGSLILQDANEILNLTGQKISLSISLSDPNGKTKSISGIVMIDNALVMESTATTANTWMNSPWLGAFHKTGGPWIYHEKLAWQYVYKLPDGGFWFWDKKDSNWWWSSEESFPYAFEHSSSSWIFFNLNSNPPKVYDFKSGRWRSK